MISVYIAAAFALYVVGLLVRRVAHLDGYSRGMDDGIEIEASLRENRQPRWSVKE